MGQPFRLLALRKALKYCAEHPKRERVWWTTPGAVADFCYALPPGIIPGEAGRRESKLGHYLPDEMPDLTSTGFMTSGAFIWYRNRIGRRSPIRTEN
jgi:hypothetical protein